MDIGTLMQLSGSALGAEKRRLETIAENLAGAEVTRTADGTPYHRKDVVFKTFDAHLKDAQGKNAPDMVRAEVAEDPRPLRSVYMPGHPDADANGYVEMPNVNVMEEMMNMISASRSYEANVRAIRATKDMVRNALRIGD
jgi:flagellar basal-body rod protein FlgC